MADSSNSDSGRQTPPVAGQKRTSASAGLNASGNGRPVKRRASKACQSCRARKVRCNVVEHGSPCTNCRLDEVECVVTESKRRKKFWGPKISETAKPQGIALPSRSSSMNNISSFATLNSARNGMSPISPARVSFDATSDHEQHVPHPLYQSEGQRLSAQDRHRRATYGGVGVNPQLIDYSSTVASGSPLFNPNVAFPQPTRSPAALPAYIKPIPQRIPFDDVEFLSKKGALSIPDRRLRNELLKSYVQWVHGYMPLLELHEFLEIIERGDGQNGKISLLLFQSVMFAGVAFVDMEHLRRAGFERRRDARKAFFQKARLLYSFDYELDRISLVQSLLLMTYWYETPDDQKDTWHWMGVAISLAHTIGLHRNPALSSMPQSKQKLWKRIWWSCYMRDRLIALGMRRPTRIKNEDYDVPMLALSDFETKAIPSNWTCVPADCTVARDEDKLSEIAAMCVAKAKLCVLISHVLSSQYSVLPNKSTSSHPDGHTRTTMMLLPRKSGEETCEVRVCDSELNKWKAELPPFVDVTANSSDCKVLILHRALLSLAYHTTISALHRPQVLPGAPIGSPSSKAPGLQEISRKKVRTAAAEITTIATSLHRLDLVRYLPTSGVTVLLPAIIIHLLDIKSPIPEIRKKSLEGFAQCMLVMERLRTSYAAADFATQFLEAAIRKADIRVDQSHPSGSFINGPVPQKRIFNVQGLIDSGLGRNRELTPPLERQFGSNESEMATRLESFLATTPPDSEHYEETTIDLTQSNLTLTMKDNVLQTMGDFDFDTLINTDDDLFSTNIMGGENGMSVGVNMRGLHGESSGLLLDMDWMNGMNDLGSIGLDHTSFWMDPEASAPGLNFDGDTAMEFGMEEFCG